MKQGLLTAARAGFALSLLGGPLLAQRQGRLSDRLALASADLFAESIAAYLAGVVAILLVASGDAVLRLRGSPAAWRVAGLFLAALLCGSPGWLLVWGASSRSLEHTEFKTVLFAALLRFGLEAWRARREICADLFDAFLSNFLFLWLFIFVVGGFSGLAILVRPLPEEYLWLVLLPAIVVSVLSQAVLGVGLLLSLAFVIVMVLSARAETDGMIGWFGLVLLPCLRRSPLLVRARAGLLVVVFLLTLPLTMVTGLALVPGLARRAIVLLGSGLPAGAEGSDVADWRRSVGAFYELVAEINDHPLTIPRTLRFGEQTG